MCNVTNIFPLMMMVVYASFLIYIVLLFGRFVLAVEHIAKKIESSFQT